MELGESPEDTLKREILEELRVSVKNILFGKIS
jgi:NADH pyrophosphatase NudC (nudix superfamily)